MLPKTRPSLGKNLDHRPHIVFRDSLPIPLEGRKSLPALTGQETDQDLIDRFNAYYVIHNHPFQDDERTISTLADTESELLRNRECRLVLMRRLMVICCLGLWGFCIAYTILWAFTFFIWPMHFSRNTVRVIEDYDSGPTEKYTVLCLLFIHTYIVSTWGIIAAYCGRKRCLKRFIITTPWFLSISFYYSYIAVIFAGSVTHDKLETEMSMRLGLYYDPPDKNKSEVEENYSKIAWDVTQHYLKCCGINEAQDWIISNEKQPEIVPASCCRSVSNRVEHDPERLADCVANAPPDLLFEGGCIEKVLKLYINVGALITAMAFTETLLLILAIIFARRYYILMRKDEYGQFHYSWREHFLDFIYVRPILNLWKKRNTDGKKELGHKEKLRYKKAQRNINMQKSFRRASKDLTKNLEEFKRKRSSSLPGSGSLPLSGLGSGSGPTSGTQGRDSDGKNHLHVFRNESVPVSISGRKSKSPSLARNDKGGRKSRKTLK